MLAAKLQRLGNRYFVTIPPEEMERLDLHEGDLVALEIWKGASRRHMDPDVQSAFDRSLKQFEEDYDYLAEN
jgi:antitoxin component of MazEF toxin-antitoxin module